jgi:hypothetical protein
LGIYRSDQDALFAGPSLIVGPRTIDPAAPLFEAADLSNADPEFVREPVRRRRTIGVPPAINFADLEVGFWGGEDR